LIALTGKGKGRSLPGKANEGYNPQH